MLDKDKIIAEVNSRMRDYNGPSGPQIDPVTHVAPNAHALIGTICDAINAELQALEIRLIAQLDKHRFTIRPYI
jgi:hypothetical protein